MPALSLPEAFLAIVLGGLIGNAMLGVAAMIGADARVPAMVLMRAPLGQRGSWGPTVLNAAQCVGWAIFELLIIATAVAALSDELLGFRAQWLWTLLFGGCRARARAARPDRVRPQVRAQVRRLGRARVAALPDVVGARRRRLRLALGPRGRGRFLGAGRRRPRRRDHRLVDPARRRLHALRPRPQQRLLGHRRSATSSRARGSGCSAPSSSSRATSPTRPRCRSRSPRAGSGRCSRCSP